MTPPIPPSFAVGERRVERAFGLVFALYNLHPCRLALILVVYDTA